MRIVVEILYGSHLYGTNTPNSDLDIKGVCLPSKDQLLTNDYPKTVQQSRSKSPGEKNTKDDVDKEYLSLDRFLQLLVEGQTMAIDMLFAPLRLNFATDDGEIWNTIYKNRQKLLSRNITSFVGYARKQASKYGIKGSRVAAVKEVLALLENLPPQSKLLEHEKSIELLVKTTLSHVSLEKTPLVEVVLIPSHKNGPLQKYLSCCGRKIPFTNKVQDATKLYKRLFEEYGARAIQAANNQGVDWKALSHAVRVNTEAIELLKTGHVTLPLPNKDLILDVKQGKMPYKSVTEMIERGLVELEEARANSVLPDQPDVEWVDNFVSKIYSEVCGQKWPVNPNPLSNLLSKIYRSTNRPFQQGPLRSFKRMVKQIYFRHKFKN